MKSTGNEGVVGGSSGNGSGTGNNTPSGGSGNTDNSGNTGGSGGNTGGSGGNTGNNSGGSQEKPTDPPKQEETPQPDPAPGYTWKYLEAESRAAFDAMNEFRRQNGVAPLTWRQDCQDAADKQAEWCAENTALDHGLSEIGQLSYSHSVDTWIQNWADSAGHKRSMLNSMNVYGAVSVHATTYSDGVVQYYIIAHFEDEGDWEVIG